MSEPPDQGLADRAAELAGVFGLGGDVAGMRFAATGEQGRVWRLDTSTGAWAVKELLVRQQEADAAADVAFQEAVLRAGTVRLPRPRRTEAGRVLAEVGPHQVRAYAWVDLLPVDQGADPALVGATLAAVHRVDHRPARALHPWYTEAVGAARWHELLRGATEAGAPFADEFAAEIPYLRALEELMEAPTNLQNCHRDLWADNLLPTPDGALCVLDWENCGLEDPSQELPMALLDFAVGDAARTRDLYAGYLDAGGPGRLRGRGAFTMVIAQFGHFWESAVVAYLAPGASAATREHSLERIGLLLGEPLRTPTLDDTLDAVSGI